MDFVELSLLKLIDAIRHYLLLLESLIDVVLMELDSSYCLL